MKDFVLLTNLAVDSTMLNSNILPVGYTATKYSGKFNIWTSNKIKVATCILENEELVFELERKNQEPEELFLAALKKKYRVESQPEAQMEVLPASKSSFSMKLALAIIAFLGVIFGLGSLQNIAGVTALVVGVAAGLGATYLFLKEERILK